MEKCEYREKSMKATEEEKWMPNTREYKGNIVIGDKSKLMRWSNSEAP